VISFNITSNTWVFLGYKSLSADHYAHDRNSAFRLKTLYIKYLYAFECLELRGRTLSDADIGEMRFISNARSSRAHDAESSRTPRVADNDSPYSADSPREVHERRNNEKMNTFPSEPANAEFKEAQRSHFRANQLSKDEFAERLNVLMNAQGISEAQIGIISGALLSLIAAILDPQQRRASASASRNILKA
jgi:hypothetical protein